MLDTISFSQRQRLAYIDFCLLFKGAIHRQDLINRFEVGLSAGSRDFTLYKELAPGNLIYDPREKRYFQTETFVPVFEHDARRTLVKLANDISDGFDAIGDIHFPVESASSLNVPDIFVVAKVVQAIVNNKAISVIYTSLSSGSGARELVPHSIVDNGQRWHVRAFDRKSQSFRDFVLTRFSKVTVKAEPEAHECIENDKEWGRLISLEIVPHPKNINYPTAIELDYAMEEGVLKLEVRAAMAGYLLRRWNVDCTKHASLRTGEYQLWLRNQQSLANTENLAIAPGYVVKEEPYAV
ncbi:WYL domain-containing protein [Alteromonas sp. KUL156]|uniref:WYL domain-containing protein n=1 Tax=Alteromonas sp. KUL106 TaxID=2480799 RepID=UPI0012E43EB4|nr:WYL domain-containing protein [Alteromonas sp. KUL106]GFD67790.1 WYL domain-containing protein [Alteromonas sp. KUL106]GFD82411.1 WYL domain-containing protein [Tenacibaculum sp. KUL118]GFD91773.1 WYL domain-containing protein [Alteromonas sp. KUL154]GFD98621.1 WYL domain-containing protein [Alteromonas sp. KUL156]